MKKIAALISCFNRKNKTLKCLEKLHFNNASNLFHLDVFLVDDGSTDGTSEAVTEFFPEVRIINGNGNLYWNRGMSLAWRTAGYSGYDYYLWLNDDVELFDCSVLKLIEIYENSSLKKPFILIGSTCDPISGQVTYGGAKRSDILIKKLRFDLINPGAHLISADTMNGNIVLVPEDISNNLTGLDQQFNHALGDTDFGLRAINAGYSLHVAPSFYGTCSHNSVANSYLDKNLSKKVRFKKMLSPKGLPVQDWAIFCRRHTGKLWLIYFLWPYFKFLIRR